MSINTFSKEKLSNKVKIAYGMGSLGNNIIYGLMTTYLTVFYTEYYGIGTAVVGTLFLVARVWDAINDPIMGIIVDNTNTRWGRFRPYLLFVPFIMGGFTILCFTALDLGPQGKIIWAYIIYIAWGMSFTAMDIPYWSMSASLSQDPEERNSIVMIPRTLATFGNILVMVITLPLLNLFGNTVYAWQKVAILYTVIAIILTLTCFLFVKERYTETKKERQTVKRVIEMFKENKPLQKLITSMLIMEGAVYIRMVFVYYYLKYVYNAEDMVPVLLGICAVVNILGSVLSPMFSKKYGKKKVAIIGSVIMAIATSGVFFTGHNSMIILIIWSSIAGVFDGMANIARMSMLVDTVEYGEWKTGKRSEGMVFSANIFKTKVASAIGGAIGMYVLNAFGYVANQPQTETTIFGIHLFFSLIPGIISLLSVLPLLKYDLTEDKFIQIVNELRKKR